MLPTIGKYVIIIAMLHYFMFSYFVYYKWCIQYEDFSKSLPCLQSLQLDRFKKIPIESLLDPSKNLLWFIHVSDIHISSYGIGKGIDNFTTFLRDVLPQINPLFVVATGDLTESAQNILDSQQIKAEWEIYRNLLEKYEVTKRDNFWIDIRGNHDAFDVPDINHKNNYFATYSQSKQYNFSRQFSKDDVKVGVVAFDACPTVGFNRFFNFVGYLTKETLFSLQHNIQSVKDSLVVVGIGHYPLSILQLPFKYPLQEITKSFSIYLCGHLHRLAGSELRTVHPNGIGEFEIPDMKNPGIFRIISVDHGLINFHDFSVKDDTFLLITNPKDARYIVNRENYGFTKKSHCIRILFFTKKCIRKESTQIEVYIDSIFIGSAIQSSNESNLYTLAWNPMNYSTGCHEIKAIVIDSRKKEVISTSFEFSIDGTTVKNTWNILHAPFGFWLKMASFGIQILLIVSLLLCCLSCNSKHLASNFLFNFNPFPSFRILYFHHPILITTILYLCSHCIVPFHVGRLVPSEKNIHFYYFYGIFDSSGVFYPILDTYLWYCVYMITIFIPSLNIVCVWLKRQKENFFSPMRIAWFVYCICFFTFDCYHCSYLALLLSSRFWIAAYYLAYGIWERYASYKDKQE